MQCVCEREILLDLNQVSMNGKKRIIYIEIRVFLLCTSYILAVDHQTCKKMCFWQLVRFDNGQHHCAGWSQCPAGPSADPLRLPGRHRSEDWSAQVSVFVGRGPMQGRVTCHPSFGWCGWAVFGVCATPDGCRNKQFFCFILYGSLTAEDLCKAG